MGINEDVVYNYLIYTDLQMGLNEDIVYNYLNYIDLQRAELYLC